MRLLRTPIRADPCSACSSTAGWFAGAKSTALSPEADLGRDHATLKMDLTVATLAAGYQFQGSKGKTYDLLLGAREVWLNRELNMNGTLTRNRELTGCCIPALSSAFAELAVQPDRLLWAWRLTVDV